MAAEPTPTKLTLYRPGRELFIFLTLLLAALILLLALRDPSSITTYLFFAAIYAVWAADTFYRRLILTADGLVYRRLLSTTTAGWKSAKAIVTAGMLTRQDSLIIQSNGSPRSSEVAVPLTYFSRSWRTGPLGQLLKENAPHLFAASDPSL